MSNSAMLPQWARKVAGLRHRLRISQAALASRLRYSAMAVSRWEHGTLEPTARAYVQLGNVSGAPECWFFWARAGIKSSSLRRLFPSDLGVTHHRKFPDFEIAVAGPGEKREKSPKLANELANRIKLVAIPVLPVPVATRGETGGDESELDQVTAEDMIAAPLSWCPNPSETSCLRVKGSSMMPVIRDGDIVAVDWSQSDPAKLNGKIVVASHRRRALSLSRFVQTRGTQLLESENSAYQPIVLSNDPSWKIVGRVLWWVSSAP